jgi:glutathione S-transferase
MLTIFGVPFSVHTRKVIVAARAKGLDYRNEPVIPFNPPENWRQLSPTGLIPVIAHDGFTLADSAAICAYLERLRPLPALLPAGAADCGRALWLEQYCGSVLFGEVVRPLFYQKVIWPHILQQGEADAEVIARVEQEVVPRVFDYLEAQVEGAFMVNGSFSLADIAVASNLINYHYLGFRVDAGRHPKLAGAFAHSLRDQAFATALAAEAPFAERAGLDRSFRA